MRDAKQLCFLSSLTYQRLVLCWVGACITWKTSMTVPNESMTHPGVVNGVP